MEAYRKSYKAERDKALDTKSAVVAAKNAVALLVEHGMSEADAHDAILSGIRSRLDAGLDYQFWVKALARVQSIDELTVTEAVAS
jgi:hypothetical protein